MLVQFPNSQKPEDAPATLKVVSWGNLAREIQQKYHQGDRVILVGRLGMNTIERPEGFKEKRAELTVQQIQSVGDGLNFSSSASATRTPSATDTNSRQSPPPVASRPPETNLPTYQSSRPPATPTANVVPQVNNPQSIPQPNNFERTTYQPIQEEEPNIDDIPF